MDLGLGTVFGVARGLLGIGGDSQSGATNNGTGTATTTSTSSANNNLSLTFNPSINVTPTLTNTSTLDTSAVSQLEQQQRQSSTAQLEQQQRQSQSSINNNSAASQAAAAAAASAAPVPSSVSAVPSPVPPSSVSPVPASTLPSTSVPPSVIPAVIPANPPPAFNSASIELVQQLANQTRAGLIDVAAIIEAIIRRLSLPTGSINAFAGSTAPPGWLFCDGSPLDVANHPEYIPLALLLGGAFDPNQNGAVYLPDIRGRNLTGAGAGPGLTARVLGERIGAETSAVPVTVPNLPPHTHRVQGTTDRGNPARYRSVNPQNGSATTSLGNHCTGWAGGNFRNDHRTRDDPGYCDHDANYCMSVHDHNVDIVSNSTGNGTPLNVPVVQPCTVVNYIIKY